MGESQNKPIQLSFNRLLRVAFQGSRVTSDGGLILVREWDERLGMGELIARRLSDSRCGRNTQLPLVDLVRQSVSELFPRVGFIVINMILPSWAVVRFYNQRGTAEQWIKGRQASGALDAAAVV